MHGKKTLAVHRQRRAQPEGRARRRRSGVRVAAGVRLHTRRRVPEAQWDKLRRHPLPLHPYLRSEASRAPSSWLFERCLGQRLHLPEQVTPASTASTTKLYVNRRPSPATPARIAAGPLRPSPKRTTSSSSPPFSERLLEAVRKAARVRSARIPPQRDRQLRAQGRLRDLSITRTNLKWGIPLPVDGHHVFYVWFDALISYMTAVRFEGDCSGPPICT